MGRCGVQGRQHRPIQSTHPVSSRQAPGPAVLALLVAWLHVQKLSSGSPEPDSICTVWEALPLSTPEARPSPALGFGSQVACLSHHTPTHSMDTSPQLLPSPDVSGAEEGNAWKAQVLVKHEDPDGDDVGVTQVVDEAADVAIVTGIDAVHLSILRGGCHSSNSPLPCLPGQLPPPTDHPGPPPQASVCPLGAKDRGISCPPCCLSRRGKNHPLSHQPQHQRLAPRHTYWAGSGGSEGEQGLSRAGSRPCLSS